MIFTKKQIEAMAENAKIRAWYDLQMHPSNDDGGVESIEEWIATLLDNAPWELIPPPFDQEYDKAYERLQEDYPSDIRLVQSIPYDNDGEVYLVKEKMTQTVLDVREETGANLVYCVTAGTDEVRYDKNREVLEAELGVDLENIDYVIFFCSYEAATALPQSQLY